MKYIFILLIIFLSISLNSQKVGINIPIPKFDLDIRGLGVNIGSTLNIGNSDNSHFLRLFSGRQSGNSSALIQWNNPDTLKMGVITSALTFRELMRLNPQGYLGLGNKSPAWSLDVLAGQAVARFNSSVAANGSVIELKNSASTPTFLGALNFNNSVNDYPGQLAYTADHNLTIRVSESEQLRIGPTGKLGIGNNNPESWVDIYRDSDAATPLLTLREKGTDYATMNFKIGLFPFEWAIKAFPKGIAEQADFLIQYAGQSNTGTKLRISGEGQVNIPTGLDASYISNGFLMTGVEGEFNLVIDNNEILARNNGVSSPLFFQRDGGDLVLCELENGRVRIGSTPVSLPTDPSYLLAVGGRIISEEVKVQLQASWPDYVFDSDYTLTPLDELEKEINFLGHLPGIPAANKIMAEGLELGEMQRLMMQKIEELTLYVLELKKENNKMAQQVLHLTESMKKE